MEKLTVGSLFSGIGGIELGFERTGGFETKWFVENEPYCQAVLRKHWPETPIYGDITKIDFKELPRVDVLTGGFPCQDISNAGKRKGIAGKRSGLWKQYIRAISEIRSKYALIENVSALRNRGLETVLCDLAKIGYNAEWHCIPASSIGAPHRRDRIFILANCNNNRCIYGKTEKFPTEAGKFTQCNTCTESPLAIPNNNNNWKQRKESLREKNRRETWATDTGILRVANGIPNRMDRIKCIGNAVVPQVAEFIGEMILEKNKMQDSI